jgi:hypothetical protein
MVSGFTFDEERRMAYKQSNSKIRVNAQKKRSRK